VLALFPCTRFYYSTCLSASSNIPGLKRDISHKQRLLDQVRETIRLRHYTYRTEQQFVSWIRRHILFDRKRHPPDLVGDLVEVFLSRLALSRQVAGATQAKDFPALPFLYKPVLNVALPWLDSVVRAKRPKRLPWSCPARSVLQCSRTLKALAVQSQDSSSAAAFAYSEPCDVLSTTWTPNTVRGGKGARDRLAELPETAIPDLRRLCGASVSVG
jgi:Phage integrase, N-terminal SAM-like domain